MKKLISLAAIVLVFGGLTQALADDTPSASDKLFQKLDANGDGKLTASEIPPEQRKFFERLLRIGDADKNGELTREEFDHALEQTEKPVTDIDKIGSLGAGPPARPNVDPKRLFQMLDKNKDGKLTRDELEGKPRLLALFDRLGKEAVTFEDVSALLGNAGKAGGKKAKKRLAAQVAESSPNKESQEMPENASGHSLPAFFRLLDTNHDGKLSAEELSQAGTLFEKLDRNHDGFIDAKEFSASTAAGEHEESSASESLPGKHRAKLGNGHRFVQQIIMRSDKDGDGKISEEEAPPQLKKHFAKIDTNGDGFLDRSELETWVKHRQKRLGNMPAENDPETPNTAKPKPSGF